MTDLFLRLPFHDIHSNHMSNTVLTSLPKQTVMSRTLVDEVDARCFSAFDNNSLDQRSSLGQFPTPPAIACFMASMFDAALKSIRLLDAGAGIGSLTAAFLSEVCQRGTRPERIEAVTFEIDSNLSHYLKDTLELCRRSCRSWGVEFHGSVRNEDFIESATNALDGGLFGTSSGRFNCAILNPPYKKINTDSHHRRLLHSVGIETSNLYTAFLGLVILLLEPGGEMVAIIPRSFCNGPYFKPFRQFFLREMSLRKIHLFGSRKKAFSDDDVLQENIILHAVKANRQPTHVIVSSSTGLDQEQTRREVLFHKLVKSDDPEQFIHIVADEAGSLISDRMRTLSHSLDDVGLSVSTGRLVDFRSRQFIQPNPGLNTIPLIYPAHFSWGSIEWPKLGHKKPNACIRNPQSEKWIIPAGIYVLVKRFSAKEEKRRIVASIFDPVLVQCEYVAFENHLNYFHEGGKGLPLNLAKGLTAFLNSTFLDTYFRQFNGHTQVNATDLKSIPYPSRPQLEAFGKRIGTVFPHQEELDRLIEQEFSGWQRAQVLQTAQV